MSQWGWGDATKGLSNLASIASKVTSVVRDSSFGDPIGDETYRKKNDIPSSFPYTSIQKDSTVYSSDYHDQNVEVEDLNSYETAHRTGLRSVDVLENENMELRKELYRVQADFHEHLATRDNHIKALEAQLLAMRKTATPPPPSSPNQTERIQVLQDKLNKAVSHLKPLMEEVTMLKEQLAEKDSESETLRASLEAAEVTRKSEALGNMNTVIAKDQLIEELEESKKLSKSLMEEGKLLKDRLAELESECETLRAGLESSKKIEERDNSMTAIEKEQLKKESEELSELSKTLTEEVRSLRERLTEKVSESETLRASLEAARRKEELDNATAANGSLIKEFEESTKLSKTLMEEVKLLNERLAEKESESDTLRASLEAVSKSEALESQNTAIENEQLVKEFEESMKRCNEMEQMMADLNAEVHDRSRALSELQTQFKTTLDDRDRVIAENSILIEKLSTVKTSVLPKLQAEIDESNRLRQEVETLQATIAALREERSLLKAQIEVAASDNSDLREATVQITALQDQLHSNQTELEAQRSENEKLQRRLAALQHHMAESEEAANQDAVRAEATLAEFRLRVLNLERERETWEEMARESREAVRMLEDREAQSRQSASLAREELDQANRERERDAVSLANLQSVLAEFQASKEAEVDFALEGMRKQLNTASKALEDYRERATLAEKRLEEIDTQAPSLSALETELSERNVEIGRLRARVISLESYLAEAVRRAGSAENQVDRRLVSNLVIQFLSANRADSKRFEMLGVIASVLRLSDEDKVKIGLLRKVGAGSIGQGAGSPSSQASESFTDLWISFLLRESSKDKISEPEAQP